jgi:hypothetical protein
LNAHVHFHCCVIDGVFAVGEDGQVHFAEAAARTPEDLAAVQQQVRARVLRWFARAGHLDPADARDMASWHHGGGFSLDASIRIEGPDRCGLERLLRYCARPPFALERLQQVLERRTGGCEAAPQSIFVPAARSPLRGLCRGDETGALGSSDSTSARHRRRGPNGLLAKLDSASSSGVDGQALSCCPKTSTM